MITACGEELFSRADHRIAAAMISSETHAHVNLTLSRCFPGWVVLLCAKWGVCAVRCGGKVVSVRRGPGHVGSGVVDPFTFNFMFC